MSMKLSYRDKVIIIIVAVIVVLGVGIFCFIKPQVENLKIAEDRLASKQAEKDQVDAKIGTLESLEKTLEDNIKAIEEDQKQFISEREIPETYQINQYIKEKLAESDVQIKGMTLNALAPTTIDAYFYNKLALAYPMKINADIANKLPEEVMNAYNNSYPAAPAGTTIAGTILNVEYECDEPDQVFEAIQAIADNEENIYLLTASADFKAAEEAPTDAEGAAVNGSLTIMIYEIYPLDPEDLKDTE